MGLINFFRSLFKKKNGQNPIIEPQVDYRAFKPYTSFDKENVDLRKYFGDENVEDFGFREAGNRNGDLLGFKIRLNRIYTWYYEERRNITRSNNDEIDQKIANLETENKILENKINFIKEGKTSTTTQNLTLLDDNSDELLIPATKENTIPYIEEQIKKMNNEIRDIEENPKHSKHVKDYDDRKNHKLNFYISLVGMVIIVIFLWIFYGSVIYSALWRNFKPGKNLLFESILYPRAFEDAFYLDVFIGIAVCALPFIFALLAFVFEYFFDRKKLLVAIPLLAFAFILDSWLAYKITERIYQITHTSFEGVARYSMGLAFQEINFWIIIFLGFGIYIFLGFVYHIFEESLMNLNKVDNAIKKRKEKILEFENKILGLKEEINKIKNKIEEQKNKITQYRKALLTTIFRFPEFEGVTQDFILGWTKYQERNKKHDLKKQCEDFYYSWIKSIEDSLVNIVDIAS